MEFKVTIGAPSEKVWRTLWQDASYREWTAVFSAGSRAETDWKKGSKILFLDESNAGMVSTVAELIPNEFMSIRHLGVVKDGVEDLENEEARQWAGAYENYTLRDVNGSTALTVTLEGVKIPPEFEDYFRKVWPKALDKLKELAETR